MLMSALTIIKRNGGREGEGEEKKREQERERERERGERQRRRESYYKRLAEAISRVNVTILRVIAARGTAIKGERGAALPCSSSP